MTVSARRVYRAAPATLSTVSAATVLAAVGLAVLAYVVHARRTDSSLPALFGLLAVAAVLYGWRFGLHPRLVAGEDALVVVNPFRRVSFPWPEITLLASGENGLVVGSEDSQVEAWCVQKSNSPANRLRRTRSDRIVAELLDLVEAHDPPLEDPGSGLRIRRARPDQSRLLTELEQAASEAAFGHIFDPSRYPYPVDEVTQRWRRLLRDRLTRVRILELHDEPVGFVAFDADTVRHLSVAPEHARRGFGTALLGYATDEMFSSAIPAARLWVLADNTVAQDFYAARGWRQSGQQRSCEFPPHPVEVELTRLNPAAPRRMLTEQRRA